MFCGFRSSLYPNPLRIGHLIIDPPLVLAPMAGVTDLVYRQLMAEFGAGLVYTGMVSMEGLHRGQKESWKLIELDGSSGVPTAVQLFGTDFRKAGETAAMVEQRGADIIDINAGCPVRKVVRQGAGAALLKRPERLARMVEEVRKRVSVPVTVKIRLGWDTINVLEVARLLEMAGADAIAVHARTAKQLYQGKANWGWLRKAGEILSIPLIGNGDVKNFHHADRMISETGCDAVMIGRASLGNPWLFYAVASYWGRSLLSNIPCDWLGFLAIVSRHLRELEECKQLQVGHYRKVLLWYSKGLPESARLRAGLSHIQDKRRMWEYFQSWVEQRDRKGVSFIRCKLFEGVKDLKEVVAAS